MNTIQLGLRIVPLAVTWHIIIEYFLWKDHRRKEDRNIRYADDIPEGQLLWCSDDEDDVDRMERYCLFQNLCYSTKFKDFFLKQGSKLNDNHEPMPDILLRREGVINLATVRGVEWFDYLQIPASIVERDEYLFREYRQGNFYMTARMTSGPNIAHDIHDVLMPVFYSLLELSGSSTPDAYEPTHTLLVHGKASDARSTPFRESRALYHAVSKEEPIFVRQLDHLLGDSVTCFENITVGVVSNVSLWYDWGLHGIPQSPLPGTKVTPEHFSDFKMYIFRKLRIDASCSSRGNYAVLFRRKRLRKILNEDELIGTLSRELNLTVIVLSNDENSIAEILEALSCAKLVVGMHGALLITTMFLPRKAVVLEMFPFAINPDNLRVYRRMLELQERDVEYVYWRNMDETRSVLPGKEQSSEFLFHSLSPSEQLQILDNEEVEPKVCCDDPELQFRLFHDTIVDTGEVIDVLRGTRLFEACKNMDVCD